ncbi:MAG: hypothetical protein ACRCTJ_01995 [Brevinema sp.]
MGFSIFIWGISALFLILDGLFVVLLRRISHLINKKSAYLLGILCLLILLLYYLPVSSDCWGIWNKNIYNLISRAPSDLQMILREVWYTFVFFSQIWPSLFFAVLVLSLKKVNHPISYRYRMIKNFGHAKILIMVATLFLFMILNTLNILPLLKMIALNIAIYTAVFYWRFGFGIIFYLSKNIPIPYELVYFSMIFLLIFVGEYFMIPLFLYVGVGITDIWMDYYQRDASAMLFEIDLY